MESHSQQPCEGTLPPSVAATPLPRFLLLTDPVLALTVSANTHFLLGIAPPLSQEQVRMKPLCVHWVWQWPLDHHGHRWTSQREAGRHRRRHAYTPCCWALSAMNGWGIADELIQGHGAVSFVLQGRSFLLATRLYWTPTSSQQIQGCSVCCYVFLMEHLGWKKSK